MPRTSDEKDSTIALWGNYILAGLITVLLFVSDWYFDKQILDGALVGAIIGITLGWITCMNIYFFPSIKGDNEKKKGE